MGGKDAICALGRQGVDLRFLGETKVWVPGWIIAVVASSSSFSFPDDLFDRASRLLAKRGGLYNGVQYLCSLMHFVLCCTTHMARPASPFSSKYCS